MNLQGSLALGPRLLIGQRQAPSSPRVSRRRATAFGLGSRLGAPSEPGSKRASKGPPKKENNKNYEASSRGSPPGYESRATE